MSEQKQSETSADIGSVEDVKPESADNSVQKRTKRTPGSRVDASSNETTSSRSWTRQNDAGVPETSESTNQTSTSDRIVGSAQRQTKQLDTSGASITEARSESDHNLTSFPTAPNLSSATEKSTLGQSQRSEQIQPSNTSPSSAQAATQEHDEQSRLRRKQSARNLREINASPSITNELTFMHPSEREFANLLDYYQIKYLYEPRSFPLRWQGNRVVEMHTPDFYLPEYDQYFELTTMKQSLVTQKNRKLRHVHELYPEINIQLLYRRDLMRLMGKYGFGPLADIDSGNAQKVLFTAKEIQGRVETLGRQISSDYQEQVPVLIGVLKGVIVFMADLIRAIDLRIHIEFMEISRFGDGLETTTEILNDVTTNLEGRPVILVEDIIDTGLTLRYLLEHLKSKNPASIKVCCLLDKSVRRMARVPVDYVGFEAPDGFIVGYGLDYEGRHRNLPHLSIIQHQEPSVIPQR